VRSSVKPSVMASALWPVSIQLGTEKWRATSSSDDVAVQFGVGCMLTSNLLAKNKVCQSGIKIIRRTLLNSNERKNRNRNRHSVGARSRKLLLGQSLRPPKLFIVS
jgi:hypothetical protein